MRKSSMLINLLFFLILFSCSASNPAYSQEIQFVTGPVATIMSTADMNANGLMFMDEPIGFIKTKNGYKAFSAGGSFNGVGNNAKLPAGTYAFAGTLNHLEPAVRKGEWPSYSLTSGRVQPSPDGSDFDRDYAGGGPTYNILVPSNNSSRSVLKLKQEGNLRHVLLQIYHGEYQYYYPKGMPAYGGSGLAISLDEGITFKKIGQILYPYLSREDYLKTNPSGGLWADGAMIEADNEGHYINHCFVSNGPLEKNRSYYYIIFTDRNSIEESGNSIALARVDNTDMWAALEKGKAPTVHKYFNPVGSVVHNTGFFTEPGIGGRSTPIIVPRKNEHINSPFIIWNVYIKKYILSYQSNQKKIMLQTSDNLYQWSPPTEIVGLDVNSDQKVFNPTMVGLKDSPEILGKNFYVYYLQRTATNNGLIEPRIQRVEVTISDIIQN